MKRLLMAFMVSLFLLVACGGGSSGSDDGNDGSVNDFAGDGDDGGDDDTQETAYVLVDFGDEESANSFDVIDEIGGKWDVLSISPNLQYKSINGYAGVATDTPHESPDKYGSYYYTYQHLSGEPINFQRGDYIRVTYYNGNNASYNIRPFISFIGTGYPVYELESYDSQWYGMDPTHTSTYDDHHIPLHGYQLLHVHDSSSYVNGFKIREKDYKTFIYRITSKTIEAGQENEYPQYISQGNHSSLNIATRYYGSLTTTPEYAANIILDKIELVRNGDITPPSVPANIQATANDTSIELTWNVSEDQLMYRYFIYVNGEEWAVTKNTHFTLRTVDPETTYNIQIMAQDDWYNESAKSAELSVTTKAFNTNNDKAGLLNPWQELVYKGAFKVDNSTVYGSDSAFHRLAYAGTGITYLPNGDAANTDAYEGALLISAHPGGSDTDGLFYGEINIPLPIISDNQDDLNTAVLINTAELFDLTDTDDSYQIKGGDVLYIDADDNHIANTVYHIAADYYSSGSQKILNVFNSDYSNKRGEYWLTDCQTSELPCKKDFRNHMMYLFQAPRTFADDHFDGRYIMVGGWYEGPHNGLGPGLSAMRPWYGGFPADGATLDTLNLMVPVDYNGDWDNDYDLDGAIGKHSYNDTSHGGAWLTSAANLTGERSAVVLGVRQGLGEHWYGDYNRWYKHDIVEDMPKTGKSGPGWRSSGYNSALYFFNPSDLADIASGEKQNHEAETYARMNLDHVFYNDNGGIASVAYDHWHQKLYVVEGGSQTIIHVWGIE